MVFRVLNINENLCGEFKLGDLKIFLNYKYTIGRIGGGNAKVITERLLGSFKKYLEAVISVQIDVMKFCLKECLNSCISQIHNCT